MWLEPSSSAAPLHPIWAGRWCFTGQEPVQCNHCSTTTQNIEEQRLVDQSTNKNEMLFCFSSFATECLLLMQTSSKCRQEKQPLGNAWEKRGDSKASSSSSTTCRTSLLLPSSLPSDCKLSEQILFWYFYLHHQARHLARSR